MLVAASCCTPKAGLIMITHPMFPARLTQISKHTDTEHTRHCDTTNVPFQTLITTHQPAV
jgi:hypothetical protein